MRLEIDDTHNTELYNVALIQNLITSSTTVASRNMNLGLSKHEAAYRRITQ